MTVLQVIHVHNVFDNVAMYACHYAEKINSDNNNLRTSCVSIRCDGSVHGKLKTTNNNNMNR